MSDDSSENSVDTTTTSNPDDAVLQPFKDLSQYRQNINTNNALDILCQVASSEDTLCKVASWKPDDTTTDKCTDVNSCLLYTSPSPRDKRQSRMPSSA